MKMKQCMVGILVLMLSFTISAEEFRTPVTIVGMVNAKNELVRPDDKMTFMSNGSTLTFVFDGAARNNDPGGGLVASAVTRDGAVYLDDNVALVFSEQPAGVIRHLAFNVNGVVFDRVRRKGAKWDDAWAAEGLEVISSEARSGRWHLAVRVPLVSVGATGTTIINVMRVCAINERRLQWQGFRPCGSVVVIFVCSAADEGQSISGAHTDSSESG